MRKRYRCTTVHWGHQTSHDSRAALHKTQVLATGSTDSARKRTETNLSMTVPVKFRSAEPEPCLARHTSLGTADNLCYLEMGLGYRVPIYALKHILVPGYRLGTRLHFHRQPVLNRRFLQQTGLIDSANFQAKRSWAELSKPFNRPA